MGNHSILYCETTGKEIELSLSLSSPEMSSADLAKCTTVFEDGWYKIELFSEDYISKDISMVNVSINGLQIGRLKVEKDFEFLQGQIEFSKENDKLDSQKEQQQYQSKGQPFLLQNDLVILSFELLFNDGSLKELFTDFLLCVSKNKEDVENINHMLEIISIFDDAQVNKWLFSASDKNVRTSLREGRWNYRAYKSLSSYVQLLEKILSCYKNNYRYFKLMGKHTIEKQHILQSYEKVRTVTRGSFQWIMKNTNQLYETNSSDGIQYNGKHYIPLKMETEMNKKSWDVYENRVILGFLYTVLTDARSIHAEFTKDVMDEERILSRINSTIPKEYRAPILTIKSIQISFCRVLLNRLSNITITMQDLYSRYTALFDLKVVPIVTLPRKTKTFQEVKPYTQVFSIILQWFTYGEFSLEKDKLILQVKTLDKLFEYFCLIELLKMLAENGYKIDSADGAASSFEYTVSDGLYQNEKDVANTYVLKKDNISATVYYQPVVSAVCFYNNLSLYRTTKRKSDYYSPDFVIKFTDGEEKEEYIIFDAKFSSRENIRRYHLPEIMCKYSHEIAVANSIDAPKMVWALQGRVTQEDKKLWRYHNSDLSRRYRPKTSFGIVSINTVTSTRDRLWKEIKNNLPWIL